MDATLLNRLCIGECTEVELKLLESRQINSIDNDHSHNVLHVYRTNNDVDERNTSMPNKLADDVHQSVINVQDLQSGHNFISIADISTKQTLT